MVMASGRTRSPGANFHGHGKWCRSRKLVALSLVRPSAMASSSIAGETVYDFWEAVTCAKCHLRFVPDAGGPPLVPFWITECGHILCNNHLSGYSDTSILVVRFNFQRPQRRGSKLLVLRGCTDKPSTIAARGQ